MYQKKSTGEVVILAQSRPTLQQRGRGRGGEEGAGLEGDDEDSFGRAEEAARLSTARYRDKPNPVVLTLYGQLCLITKSYRSAMCFGSSETAPETFRFGNGFGSTYSVLDTLGFGKGIWAPESSDFREWKLLPDLSKLLDGKATAPEAGSSATLINLVEVPDSD
ncbi:hypothetical protein B0H14DRAFT_2622295 [Mycena olivaceomarginata]|nr:hypothetical protein B0H14DRAFT_2622295 [Mycena olivaceomarginata]